MLAVGRDAGLDPASGDFRTPLDSGSLPLPKVRNDGYIRRVCAGALIICSASAAAQSISDAGTRTTHALRQEPHRAAVCVARNLDRHSSGLLAQIRQGAEPALVEIQVRAIRLAALAEFLLAPEGSTALIWTTRERAGEREALVAAMIEGC